MRRRTFYTIAILLPAAALALIVPFAGPPVQMGPPLGPGGTEVWLYPRFALRELAAYCLMAGWLLWQLRSRTPAEFARVLRWAPLVLVAVSVVMLMPFILVQGRARDVFGDDAGRIVLRMVVRLAMGYVYIGLLELVRTRLLGIELTDES